MATPIGNRADITARARDALAAADIIAAEDTRHTGRLLQYLGIAGPTLSLHEHNEAARIPELVARLQAGERVALVSDAGTPALSDPGYRLVVAVHEAGLPVVPIPGPSAITAALAVAGQPTDRFLFAGFPPARGGPRSTWLGDLATQAATVVLFESCHRLRTTLADLVDAFGGDRPATLCRELTKQYETVQRSTLGELRDRVEADRDQQRGEVVLVIAGAAREPGPRHDLETLLDALLPELPPTRAAAVAARLTGCARREAYRAALARQQSQS